MRKPITTTHTAKPNKDPNNRAAPTLATHKEPHGDMNELQARHSNTARPNRIFLHLVPNIIANQTDYKPGNILTCS
jgi:hypothetical protein